MRSIWRVKFAAALLLLLAGCAPQLGYRAAEGECKSSEPRRLLPGTGPEDHRLQAARATPRHARELHAEHRRVRRPWCPRQAGPARPNDRAPEAGRLRRATCRSSSTSTAGGTTRRRRMRDVENFQNLLGLLDLAEQAAAAAETEVVGIYVAWPGALFAGRGLVTDIVNTPSFWTRKEGANRVAEGTIRELFGKVREIQQERNGACDGTRRQAMQHAPGHDRAQLRRAGRLLRRPPGAASPARSGPTRCR